MKRYIVVDDDPTNNLICKLTITKYEPEAQVQIFQSPEDALKYIANEENVTPSFLLLDINMPTMTGWEFLTEFMTFEEEVKRKYFIYILSSSYQDLNDNNRNYPFLCGFFSKPLKKEYLREMSLTYQTSL